MPKLHILAFGAHPDDVELSCSGTLLKHLALGHQVGIIDLTRGELGTRGTSKTRDLETKNATSIMRIRYRENLSLKDGFFKNDEAHQLKITSAIRTYQPDIVLCNALDDRHPDHGRAAHLVSDSCFLSGLLKIKTRDAEGNKQLPWRPRLVLHYIQDRYCTPSFLVDISGYMKVKMEAIRAYKTQFFNPDSKEPGTYISSPVFLNSLENRAAEFGRIIGVDYAEGFTCERIFGVNDLNTLI